jgi:dephospho-CoA kinase
MTTPAKRVPVIGLVGGVGSGKSSVAAQFARLGCPVVDADRIGHALLLEPAIRGAIRKRFGEIVINRAGRVNRQRLAEQVFSNREKLNALNSIVHPELWRRFREKAEALRRRGRGPAIILDAALLMEKGLDILCDHVVYLDVPEEVRQVRAAEARGWDPSDVSRREAMQLSLKLKRARADFIIDNSASPKHTLGQIRTILSRVTKG